MSQTIAYYKNVVFYQGHFYTDPDHIKTVSLHNRINTPYTPSDIRLLKTNTPIEPYPKGILLVDGFHGNMGHLLWDCMYPSWYGLFKFRHESAGEDFQWMVQHHHYLHEARGWNVDVIERFSGCSMTTPQLLAHQYASPLRIPYLIVGCTGIGIGCVDPATFCARREHTVSDTDPIEYFVNRMFQRYDVTRNSFLNPQYDRHGPVKVIYVVNKRPYVNIEAVLKKMQKRYAGRCEFGIVDWTRYSFAQQLEELNKTAIVICGVGTARANTPFLPNGALEIQTNTHSLTLPQNINYFDYHLGTLSSRVKVINISAYSLKEARKKACSEQLCSYIDLAVSLFPNCEPVSVMDNIPRAVLDLKEQTSREVFEAWRASLSNDVGKLFSLVTPPVLSPPSAAPMHNAEGVRRRLFFFKPRGKEQ
jgi:hypothetical protein